MTNMQDYQFPAFQEDDKPPLSYLDLNTLADALAFTRLHHILSPRTQADVTFVVNELGQAIGLSPDQLPAAPEQLIPIIKRASSLRRRVGPQNWLRALSLIRTLLWVCGCHAPEEEEVASIPSHPAWVVLVIAIPHVEKRGRILGFARWCADSGIRPDEVTEETLDRYGQFCRSRIIGFGPFRPRSLLGIIRSARVRIAKAARTGRRLPSPGEMAARAFRKQLSELGRGKKSVPVQAHPPIGSRAPQY